MQIWECMVQVIWEVMKWIILDGLGHITYILNFDLSRKIEAQDRNGISVGKRLKDDIITTGSKKMKERRKGEHLPEILIRRIFDRGKMPPKLLMYFDKLMEVLGLVMQIMA